MSFFIEDENRDGEKEKTVITPPPIKNTTPDIGNNSPDNFLSATPLELEQQDFPPFVDVVTYICDKVTEHYGGQWNACTPTDQATNPTIPFQSSVFLRILTYARQCLGVCAGVDETDAMYVREGGAVGMRLTGISNYLDSVEMGTTLSGSASIIRMYQQLIECGLRTGGSRELHCVAMESLVELVAALPELLAPGYHKRMAWLQVHICTVKGEGTEERV